MEKALREKLAGGTFENGTSTNSKRMSAVKGRGNKTTELLYRLMLVRAGIAGWKMHPKGVIGKPDFFFPAERLAVFVDGCFWHGCSRCGHVPKVNNSFWAAKLDRNRERDAENVAMLHADGIRSLRIWEHEIKEDACACIVRLKALLAQR
jgi:DNA mismatch endonuclease Vsr